MTQDYIPAATVESQVRPAERTFGKVHVTRLQDKTEPPARGRESTLASDGRRGSVGQCIVSEQVQSRAGQTNGEVARGQVNVLSHNKKTWNETPHNRLRSQNSSKEYKFHKKNSQMKSRNKDILVNLKWQGTEDPV